MASSVTLYRDADFSGSARSFAVGSYVLAGTVVGNDAVSSLKVPSGLKATLYEHSDFSGRTMVCVRDTSYVGDEVNDEVSAIKVEERGTPRVILYKDPGYRGWSQEIGVGRYSSVALGNDCVSSLIVPLGFRVKLYKDTDFGGEMQVFYGNASSLGDFGNEASSVVVEEIEPAPAPTLEELKALVEQVGPRIDLHPDDSFRPSSVEWFLERATLKGKDGSSRPAASAPLPAGGSDDGQYWLEIGVSHRPGALSQAVAYVNAKCDNSYWIDLQFWIFYPYNGAGTAWIKVPGETYNVDLTPLGQHGGDWEHVTLRVELATKKVSAVYLAQHSGGEWRSIGGVTTASGRPVVYASKHGHASYRDQGMNPSNELSFDGFDFALRNDADNGGPALDCAAKYRIIGAAYLGAAFTAPDWVNYCRRWGPHIVYKKGVLEGILPSVLWPMIDTIWDALPEETREENGPTGPWRKGSWDGPE